MCVTHLYITSGSLHPADEALLEEEVSQQPESKRYMFMVLLGHMCCVFAYSFLMVICSPGLVSMLRMCHGYAERNTYRQSLPDHTLQERVPRPS